MASLFQRIARSLNFLVVAGIAVAALAAGPYAHGEPGDSTAPSAGQAPHENSAPDNKSPAQAVDSRINKAEIVKRVNQELGIDLEATTAGWQRVLDGLESDLAGPRQRYSDLNRLRDALQRIRSDIADASNKIQPRLDADRAQLKLLGPAPAAGQPQEPEQAAVGRAELNYHFGLLSAGQAAVNSTNLRIDNLLNTIQEIRRKNFASALFQPIPGLYAYETWAKLPEYVPQAASKLRELIADWWRDVQDRDGVTRIAVEALLMSLLLSFASWRGVRRLRRWQDVGEPPYWRRASSAAGVILLRSLPVVAPVVFLYVMTAGAESLPERLDWLFYLTAQSIVIVFTVGALVTAAFAPGRAAMATHCRFGPARCAHMRSRRSACIHLQPVESALRHHPLGSGAVCTDHRRCIAVEPASGWARCSSPEYDAGGRRWDSAVGTLVPRDPPSRLGHRRGDRRVRADRLSAVSSLPGAAIDRDRFDPRTRVSAAALGRWLRARAERRRYRDGALAHARR